MTNIHVVADPPVLEAFELIGLRGQLPPSNRNLGDWLAELVHVEGVQLLLIQSRFAAQLAEEQLDQLTGKLGCLVVEVPGLGEAAPDPAEFRRWMHRAIGVGL